MGNLAKPNWNKLAGVGGKREEKVFCWMSNLVRQEGQEEKVMDLARRCMLRFLDTLDEESYAAWRCSELLAAACLLVTSKTVSAKPLSAKVLLNYANSDFTMEELMVRNAVLFPVALCSIPATVF